MTRTILVITTLAAAMSAGCATAPTGPDAAARATGSVTPREVERSIRRGLDYLVESQNPDGSWGSARRTKALNIVAPAPGAHRSFRAAVTALCVSALIASADPGDGAAMASLRRGEDWLLANLGEVKRDSMVTLYNNWAHAYGLAALAAMHGRAADEPERRARIADAIALQYKRLDQFEFVGGGWGYYDFDQHTAQPGGDPTSFTTATVLIAMREAADAGFDPPRELVDAGLREIVRERRPDGSYLYSRNWWVRPTGTVNQPGGAMGRVQVCNAALRMWGDERITDEVIGSWLEILFERNGWLDMGRKRPIPHESYFAVAGYFFYYGHYYAGYCIDMLPEGDRPRHLRRLADVLVRLQEADGSWWDYPLYDYHQPYGTALALMALERCRAGSE